MSHYQNMNWIEEMDPVSEQLLSLGRVQVFTKYTCIIYGSKAEVGSHALMLSELTSQHLQNQPQAQGMASTGSVIAEGLWSLSRG